jgi:hypothetical protein
LRLALSRCGDIGSTTLALLPRRLRRFIAEETKKRSKIDELSGTKPNCFWLNIAFARKISH